MKGGAWRCALGRLCALCSWLWLWPNAEKPPYRIGTFSAGLEGYKMLLGFPGECCGLYMRCGWLWLALLAKFPSATSLAASLRRESFSSSSVLSYGGSNKFCAMLGSVASAVGFFARFFLLVVTSAILISELRLTPRALVFSFDSIKSFSSITKYD